MGNTLPYLGVSGITKFNETFVIMNYFNKIIKDLEKVNYMPVIGFPVSRESSLPGLLNIKDNEYVSVNSLIKNIEKIAVLTRKKVRGMICYTAQEPEKLLDDIRYIYSQFIINGTEIGLLPFVRLDATNFKPSHLEKLVRTIPQIQISLLVSKHFMGASRPHQIGEEVERFEDYATYALIELGNGWMSTEKDREKALEIYEEIRERCPAINLGFAGRINENGKELRDVMKDLSDKTKEKLSLDSVGRTTVIGKDGKSLEAGLSHYILSGNERIR